MKSSGTRSHPHFLGRAVPINDNLAAIGKLDLEHTGTGHYKIQIGPTGIQSGFNPFQRRFRKRIEFALIHPVLPFFICN